MPSLGVLIGSRVSDSVFDAVNAQGHSSFFGQEFDNIGKEFFSRYVKPMNRVAMEIQGAVNALINPDQFRPLLSVEDLRYVPPCMEYAIASFAPIRQGILEGRMESFGWNVESFPAEDVYGRLIDNFACDDVAAASDDVGNYEISSTSYSDDPDLSSDDLYAIRVTRDYILHDILKNTERDPCAIDLPRG